eukprot:Pgem_evm1s14880
MWPSSSNNPIANTSFAMSGSIIVLPLSNIVMCPTNRICYNKNENTWENGLLDSSVVKSKLPERVGRGFDSRSVIHFPTH